MELPSAATADFVTSPPERYVIDAMLTAMAYGHAPERPSPEMRADDKATVDRHFDEFISAVRGVKELEMEASGDDQGPVETRQWQNQVNMARFREAFYDYVDKNDGVYEQWLSTCRDHVAPAMSTFEADQGAAFDTLKGTFTREHLSPLVMRAIERDLALTKTLLASDELVHGRPVLQGLLAVEPLRGDGPIDGLSLPPSVFELLPPAPDDADENNDDALNRYTARVVNTLILRAFVIQMGERVAATDRAAFADALRRDAELLASEGSTTGDDPDYQEIPLAAGFSGAGYGDGFVRRVRQTAADLVKGVKAVTPGGVARTLIGRGEETPFTLLAKGLFSLIDVIRGDQSELWNEFTQSCPHISRVLTYDLYIIFSGSAVQTLFEMALHAADSYTGVSTGAGVRVAVDKLEPLALYSVAALGAAMIEKIVSLQATVGGKPVPYVDRLLKTFRRANGATPMDPTKDPIALGTDAASLRAASATMAAVVDDPNIGIEPVGITQQKGLEYARNATRDAFVAAVSKGGADETASIRQYGDTSTIEAYIASLGPDEFKAFANETSTVVSTVSKRVNAEFDIVERIKPANPLAFLDLANLHPLAIIGCTLATTVSLLFGGQYPILQVNGFAALMALPMLRLQAGGAVAMAPPDPVTMATGGLAVIKELAIPACLWFGRFCQTAGSRLMVAGVLGLFFAPVTRLVEKGGYFLASARLLVNGMSILGKPFRGKTQDAYDDHVRNNIALVQRVRDESILTASRAQISNDVKGVWRRNAGKALFFTACCVTGNWLLSYGGYLMGLPPVEGLFAQVWNAVPSLDALLTTYAIGHMVSTGARRGLLGTLMFAGSAYASNQLGQDFHRTMQFGFAGQIVGPALLGYLFDLLREKLKMKAKKVTPEKATLAEWIRETALSFGMGTSSIGGDMAIFGLLMLVVGVLSFSPTDNPLSGAMADFDPTSLFGPLVTLARDATSDVFSLGPTRGAFATPVAQVVNYIFGPGYSFNLGISTVGLTTIFVVSVFVTMLYRLLSPMRPRLLRPATGVNAPPVGNVPPAGNAPPAGNVQPVGNVQAPRVRRRSVAAVKRK